MAKDIHPGIVSWFELILGAMYMTALYQCKFLHAHAFYGGREELHQLEGKGKEKNGGFQIKFWKM